MSTSIDEQFIAFIVTSLVSNPDAVKVVRSVDEKGVLLELTVDPEDLGRVIGKRGATAQSLRTLLRALGTKNDARYNLKIVDNGSPKPDRENREDSHESKSQEPAEEPVEAVVDEHDEVDEPTESSSLSQTRKELEELDDLDL
jgi:predicted RNA-binding protein YlqC (UPF0109 family)